MSEPTHSFCPKCGTDLWKPRYCRSCRENVEPRPVSEDILYPKSYYPKGRGQKLISILMHIAMGWIGLIGGGLLVGCVYRSAPIGLYAAGSIIGAIALVWLFKRRENQ